MKFLSLSNPVGFSLSVHTNGRLWSGWVFVSAGMNILLTFGCDTVSPWCDSCLKERKKTRLPRQVKAGCDCIIELLVDGIYFPSTIN